VRSGGSSIGLAHGVTVATPRSRLAASRSA
jgi:hypothetical protein